MKLEKFIGNKIKEYRQSKKLTQSDLALKLATTKQTISRYERGYRKVNQDILFKLTEIFNVSLDDFFPDSDISIDILEQPMRQTILSSINETSSKLDTPRQQKVLNYAEEQLQEQNSIIKESVTLYDFELYGYASAGTGQELLDEVIEVVQTPNKPPRHDIALQVVGDSMEPLFKDKEYIFVDTNAPIIDGMIGIVIVNNETYIKKVYVENNQLRLVSLNKDYEDIVVRKHDNYKFIGKVVL